MKIQLDASALAALFPEGSEQRLELTAAVVNNFVDRLAIGKIDKVNDVVLAQVNETIRKGEAVIKGAAEKALKDAGLMRLSDGWSRAVLTADAEADIRSRARQEFNNVVDQAVATIAASAHARLEAMVDSKLEQLVSSELNTKLAQLVDARIRAKFSS